MLKNYSSLGKTQWQTLLWIFLLCHRLSAEVLRKKTHFIAGKQEVLSLLAPPLGNGMEFIWEWKPHDSNQNVTQIAAIGWSDGHLSMTITNPSFRRKNYFDISMDQYFENAGVYSFKKIKPASLLLAQFEVFAFKVTPYRWPEVPLGSDVSRSCGVSHLPESATLQWEKEGDPTDNTTLRYNNTAHLIIHNAGPNNQGKYSCVVRGKNGEHLFSVYNEVKVAEVTYRASHTVYRQSSNSSEVILTCRCKDGMYKKATWYWTPLSGTTKIRVASAERPDKILIGKDKERFSAAGFNGKEFPLRITPVQFGDSGTYECNLDKVTFGSITVLNVQVSVEPPGSVSRNQPVVLTCEVSKVTGSLTLAWMRMEERRGFFVQQTVLTEGQPDRKLNVTLHSLSKEQLHWECVVFTDSLLRVRLPLHLTPSAPSGNGQLTLIIMPCVAVVLVGMLMLVGMVFYYKRRPVPAPVASPSTGNDKQSQSDVIYSNIMQLCEDERALETPPEEDKYEIHYSSFSLGSTSPGAVRKQNNYRPDSINECLKQQSDTVVYSSLNVT
ncbi:hypothetical protein MATL_G00151140 [Megalops atlanticus]|uniref:Ig-like domain-containing protein n=1 Tax=Megalops atlanticus TaxID=7932 RepID=A0A9D3PWL2_MEGAT|nr:hypothetical protein MATL_G00151140 [Megalops atlanticus]